jgi:hypothetical protein
METLISHGTVPTFAIRSLNALLVDVTPRMRTAAVLHVDLGASILPKALRVSISLGTMLGIGAPMVNVLFVDVKKERAAVATHAIVMDASIIYELVD